MEDLLGSIAVPEPLSLETVGNAEGVSLLARFRGAPTWSNGERSLTPTVVSGG